METLIASIFLSLSTNVDNLAVGMAYGVKKSAISLQANFLIAFLSGTSTFIAMSAGVAVNEFLSPNLAQKLGSAILILIGFWTILKLVSASFSKTDEKENLGNTHSSEQDFSDTIPTRINLQEALILGLALTITNFGTGVGAGLAQLDPVLTSFLSFLSSLMTIGGGAFLGNLITSQFSSRRLEWLSGGLLLALGLYEFLL